MLSFFHSVALVFLAVATLSRAAQPCVAPDGLDLTPLIPAKYYETTFNFYQYTANLQFSFCAPVGISCSGSLGASGCAEIPNMIGESIIGLTSTESISALPSGYVFITTGGSSGGGMITIASFGVILQCDPSAPAIPATWSGSSTTDPMGNITLLVTGLTSYVCPPPTPPPATCLYNNTDFSALNNPGGYVAQDPSSGGVVIFNVCQPVSMPCGDQFRASSCLYLDAGTTQVRFGGVDTLEITAAASLLLFRTKAEDGHTTLVRIRCDPAVKGPLKDWKVTRIGSQLIIDSHSASAC